MGEKPNLAIDIGQPYETYGEIGHRLGKPDVLEEAAAFFEFVGAMSPGEIS